MNCIICGNKPDKNHVKTRGAGGEDDEHNLMNLCRKHHVEIHQIGTVKFAEKYLAAYSWLLNSGWELSNMFGVLKWRKYK